MFKGRRARRKVGKGMVFLECGVLGSYAAAHPIA